MHASSLTQASHEGKEDVMNGKEVVLPLPECPREEMGTSRSKHKHFKAEVSNKAGYLCHIHVEATFDVPPEVVYQIFTHPDNSGVFRDIKAIGSRRVLEEGPNYKKVEVEQVGELRILWMHRTFCTFLTVTEDARDPELLITAFELMRSDVLAKFGGRWELRPVRDEVSGQVVGTHGTLTQDVLPRGCPPFLQRVPVLGGVLRKVSLNTIERLMADILLICKRYKDANGSTPVDQIMTAIAAEGRHSQAKSPNPTAAAGVSGAAAAAGAAAPGVRSFAVGGDDWQENEEGSEEEGEGSGVLLAEVDDGEQHQGGGQQPAEQKAAAEKAMAEVVTALDAQAL